MKAVEAASGEIVLMGENDRLIDLWRITKSLNIFKIFDLKDEALNHLTP